MILNQYQQSDAQLIGDIHNNKVGIDTQNIDFITSLLTTNLYSQPIQSFIRETVANGRDSHVEAGTTDKPVIIRLYIKDNHIHIAVRDYGTGLSPERFNKIYLNIGSSSKRDSNDYIGAFGIGRWSQLAVSDVSRITNYYNGTCTKYIAYKDNGKICIDKLFESTTEEAIEMFRQAGSMSKVKLLESSGRLYTTYYDLDGYKDYYYGTLLTNTEQIYLFGLEYYFDGILLRLPTAQDPSKLGAFIRQDKMFEIFKEHHRWQDILGLRTVGDLNKAIEGGRANELIQLSEALQEKKIAQIADEIAKRKTVKMVLIAGPSSSGKTTTCKRLSIQLAVNGIYPVGISLDDYFLDRDKTPRDEDGEYDFEHLHALNIPLLNEQMNALFRGEEIELPRYNFQKGKSEMSGKKLKLKGNEVLILEGIHALNPELTAQIPNEQIFRVYASALTTILLDNHNYIPTTDNRLLRRIIRDHKYRGVNALGSIRRWASVRKGENRWIFPYQENADAIFNSAMLFELAVIKQQAEPLLDQVPENCEEYAEAYRLLKFLRYIKPIPEDQIPPTSLLREFLGGSSFEY